jgi:hypothetical protein
MTVSQTDLDTAIGKLRSEMTGDPTFDVEHRTQREAAAENMVVKRKEVLREVLALDGARLAEIGECNTALIAFRESLKRVKELTADEARLWGKLGDVPCCLQQGDINATIGGAMVEELSTIPNFRGGFGPIRFSGSTRYKVGSNWRDKETQRIQPFKRLLEAKHGR